MPELRFIFMKDKYTIHTYPKSRIGTFDIGRISLLKHHVAGLIEVDVTVARNKIAALKRGPAQVSFTSWLIKCIGDISQKYPLLHGVKGGKRKIITFQNVDISIIIEKEINSVFVPLPYIIHEVNRKSISEIYNEINNVKKQSIRNESDYVLGRGYNKLLMNFYYLLPGFIRRLFWKIIISSPSLVKNMLGTVVFTSVGMVSTIKGWIIPRSVNPLCIAVSSINSKPGVINNRIMIREYLPITILIDHDVIDGAPAVRILNELVKAIESAYLL